MDQFPKVIQTAFVFAARYTHNRNTGGTLAMTRALALAWPQLDDQTRSQILIESMDATCNIDDWDRFRRDFNTASAKDTTP